MTITVTEKDFARLANRVAMYVRVAAGLRGFSIDVGGNGHAIADYDPLGFLVGVEFLGPCEVTVAPTVLPTRRHIIKDVRRPKGSPNGHKNAKRKVGAA